MITQQDINNFRNSLANTYTRLDDFLKSKTDKTVEEVQLLTAQLLTRVIDDAFKLKDEEDDNSMA